MSMRWARTGRGLLVPGLALSLVACGTAPPAPSAPAEPVAPPVAQAVPDPWQRGLADFERRQRASAEAAAAQGRWAEAVAAWDVVSALRPDDGSVAARLAQARSSAEAAVAERLQRGRQAQQRGDGEAAARAFLEALAIQPGQPEASEALRAMERERVRRQHLGKLSRYALTSSPTTPSAPPAQQNEIEHASLLAEQGEVDAAIAMLKPLADKSGGDSPARRLLAEIHFRQSEGLISSNKAAAIAALERCLQLQPGHAAALALLRTIRPQEPTTATPQKR